MPAEQVLRAMLVKQLNSFSYEELAFHLADSNSYRWFCRLGIADKPPKKSTLQKNIKRIRAETWEAINRMLVGYAFEHKIERGEKVRTDCTAVESNIRHPNDSSLLWDCVRVLVRLMGSAHDDFGLTFNDHSRRADIVVEQGNPADVMLAVEMIERQRGIFGKAPRQVSFDGGFASRQNLADIKKLGVRDVAFSKRVGLRITEMVKSSWVYRRLRDFRSGLEGIISFLKRGFGLARLRGADSSRSRLTSLLRS